ncbi:unnamed protein product [Calypogeia fissa]
MVDVQSLELPGVVTLGHNLLEKLSVVENSVTGVHWERENFLQLGEYLKRLEPIVVEVNKARESSPNLLQILESLSNDVENANQLIKICTRKSRIYLLTHCRSVVKQLESVTHSIGRSVGLLPLSAVQELPDTKQLIDSLSQEMQKAEYQVQETEERIYRSLEEKDSVPSDIAVQTGIVMDIARTVGVKGLPHNPNALKDQIELLRSDMQDSSIDLGDPNGDNNNNTGENHRVGSYDLHMVDIIGNIFESWVQVYDHPSPSSETQQRLHSRIEPLYEAFVCPLTKQVMVEPVTLENGQTYEKSAIERWFKQCEDDKRPITCPMTGQVLQSTTLKPSIALRNTIDEWTNRNEMARIDNARLLIANESCPEEDLSYALKDLQALVARKKINKYRIRTAGLIPLIVEMLKTMEQVRVRALILLRELAEDDNDSKEAMVEAGALRSVLKCLARSASGERQEAASLLYELSNSEDICEEMGSTNGMILYLVGITSSKSDNIIAVEKAEATLENLEKVDGNVRQLAENGRVQPLLRRLIDGSDETQLEMANDLSNIPLTTEAKILVAEQGASTLVSMLDDPEPASREVALKALRTLSTLESNGRILIDAGILFPLMKDLFMEGPASAKMKEVCAAVLANVVGTSSMWQHVPIDDEGNTLVSEKTVHNLLYLIGNTGPGIEIKLLQVLVGLASSQHAVTNLVAHIRSSGAIISLIQFLEAPQDQLRVPAVKLLHILSAYMGQELADGLRITTKQLGTLIRLLDTDGAIEEQSAAAGLIANLPVDDFHLTRSLYEEGALPILVTRIGVVNRRNVRIGEARFMNILQEGLVTILARFTYTLEDRDVVNQIRQHDLATFFTGLLQNTRLDEVQRQSAIGLENLSTFTPLCSVEVPMATEVGKFKRFFGCFKSPPPPVGLCPIHGGRCSSRETFCLIEAKALEPLVSLLDHYNVTVVEAALGALSTVLLDNVDYTKGVLLLHSVNAIQPILDIMQEHKTQMVRQKTVYMLERILRNTELAQLIAADQNVHTGLVDALRHGNAATKPLAEKCLKHLNKIPNFSGVFTRIGGAGRGQRPPGY